MPEAPVGIDILPGSAIWTALTALGNGAAEGFKFLQTKAGQDLAQHWLANGIKVEEGIVKLFADVANVFHRKP